MARKPELNAAFFKKMGAQGGSAAGKSMSKAARSERARKAANAKWKAARKGKTQ